MIRSEELIAAFLDETITDAELDELQVWLKSDPEHMRIFVEANGREQQLRSTVVMQEKLRLVETLSSGEQTDELRVLATMTGPLDANVPQPRRVLAARPASIALGVLVCVSAIGLWFAGQWPDSVPIDDGPSLLTVTASRHGQWADGGGIAAGDKLTAGTWHWQSGVVELVTESDTVLVIEAPVSLEMVDHLHARLLAGNVVVRMPQGRSGFVLETPRLRVFDLGTEFGVSVSSTGDTQIQVFEGKVEAEITGVTARKQLRAGETFRAVAGGDLQTADFEETRFIRGLFPRKSGVQYGGVLYSESSVNTVRVTRADSELTLDGDLTEWDSKSGFHSACLPPYASTYFLSGMTMYDADHLYLAAHVGDPEPMRNSAPEGFEFAGGSVIVRVSTDRAMGWPLQGTLMEPGTRNLRPKPFPAEITSKRIVSIIMWYDADSSRPRIKLQYGLDMHHELPDPSGWTGAFRKDKDGRGYSLEYAIPWRLLNCEDQPPTGGETFPMLWMAHWSDQEGRIARGQLVEVTNHEPHAGQNLPPSVFFQNGPSWGKAIYLR